MFQYFAIWQFNILSFSTFDLCFGRIILKLIGKVCHYIFSMKSQFVFGFGISSFSLSSSKSASNTLHISVQIKFEDIKGLGSFNIEVRMLSQVAK